MKRRFRLTKSTDFKRVRRLGKSYAHPLVVLVACRNQLDGSRIGVVAGRSVGGAVQRNRAKRLLRAAFQPELPVLCSGWDLILIARQPMASAAYWDVQAALRQLLRRARLIQVANDEHDAH